MRLTASNVSIATLGLALMLASAGGAAPQRARRPAPQRPVKAAAAKKPTKAPPVKSPPIGARKSVGPTVKSLEVLPPRITLSGSRSRQLLLVTATYSNGDVRDVSTEARYVSKQPRVAAVTSAGLVTPGADGNAELVVALGAASVRLPVTVSDASSPAPVSFVRDIVPVLTQAGCNSLNCHGSPVGKAGFKLSMYGSAPVDDHQAITTQDRAVPEKGKRIDAAPENSLILAKPSMTVPHQGGKRLRNGSPEYATLLAWLRDGAPNDAVDAARVVSLEVEPRDRVLPRPGRRQRLLVTARYTDGESEDVTHKAILAANDESIAAVADGVLESASVGETAVLARYLGSVGIAQFYVPQPDAPSPADYAGFRPINFVDELALAKWRKMGFVPSATAGDAEFLRRVRLDLTGTLPTPDEIRAFLLDAAPDKRARKIDELLQSPEYADWWTLFWGDVLRNNSRFIQQKGAQAYRAWIRESVASNKPLDQFARELVTASGTSFKDGPANFYRVANTTIDRAEQVAQVFLGVRLNCAQCHNHPFERWTRNDYHQFAAVFTRVQTKGLPANETEVSVQPKGDYKHPETRVTLEPTVLGEAAVTFPEERDRREVLADWLVSRQNPFFARNLANRVWGQLFGRGIVEPVDDLRVTNPAVNEPLLAALAKELGESGYDLRSLLRTVANSRTYQLSVAPNNRNRQDRQSFSRAYYRRLKAEALIDGICQATNMPETYAGHPAGTRAAQLTDNRVNSYFLDTFGRPRREVTCTCEREETANITQALHLMNGPINQKIGAAKGRLGALIESGQADAAILEELYLWTLCRAPTPAEAVVALQSIEAAGAGGRKQALEDRFWVLLNSREFLFNH